MYLYGLQPTANTDTNKKVKVKASPLALHMLSLFTESYADMVAPDAEKTETGYTAPVNECMDQAVTHIKNTHEKSDPAIYDMRVRFDDILKLSKSPEQEKLNTIIEKNDDYGRFIELYTDFIIATGKMLQKENWVSPHFFKLRPDLSPGVEAYEGRDFSGLTDAERRKISKGNPTSYAVLFRPI